MPISRCPCYTFSEMKNCILGIDLGGTKILAALADTRGNIINQVSLPTQPRKGPRAVLNNIITAARSAQLKGYKIKKIGISAAGPIDLKTGIITDPPNLPFKRLDLKGALKKAFRVPVCIENDANAAALAELRFGAGRKARNFIYITISTGIGGGLILDGKLYRGANGAAGEVGHMVIDKNGRRCGCGMPGDLEVLGSGRAFKPDPKSVEKAARRGKAWAKKEIDRVARDLGLGLASLTNIFDPGLIIIGGGIANMGELLLNPVRRYLKQFALPLPAKKVKIVKARFINEGALRGALAICLEGTKR